MPTPTWTCLGRPAERENLNAAADGDGWLGGWTINPKAAVGDTALFYLTGESSFVATGLVVSNPERGTEEEGWAKHHLADIDDVRMLVDPLHLRDAKERFPDWGWLRNPMRSSETPKEAAAFFEAEDSSTEGVMKLSATEREEEGGGLEGERYEVVSWNRRRDPCLRREALDAAGGVCAACGTDFNALFGDALDSTRVLHVHHLHPLGEREAAEETRPEDLAVVCANCHALLHACDPLMPVEHLRDLWAARAATA